MIEKTTVIDAITIDGIGSINVRRVEIILEDGVEIARKPPHHHVLLPGDSLEGQDEKVANIARAVWTDDLVAARRKRDEEIVADMARVATAK